MPQDDRMAGFGIGLAAGGDETELSPFVTAKPIAECIVRRDIHGHVNATGLQLTDGYLHLGREDNVLTLPVDKPPDNSYLSHTVDGILVWDTTPGGGSTGPVDWFDVYNTPITLGGYGIQDAYTKTETQSIINNITFPDTGFGSPIGGIAARNQLPAELAYEDEANDFNLVQTFNGGLLTDTIDEATPDFGVALEGVPFKDGRTQTEYLEFRSSNLLTETWHTLDQFIDEQASSGWDYGGTLSATGPLTVTIAAGGGFFVDQLAEPNDLYYVEWDDITGVAIPAGSLTWVGVKWDGPPGLPYAVVKLSNEFNYRNEWPLGTITTNLTQIFGISQNPFIIRQGAAAMGQRIIETDYIARVFDQGVIIGETDDTVDFRYVTMSAGTIWAGLERVNCPIVNTLTGAPIFAFTHYHSGTGIDIEVDQAVWATSTNDFDGGVTPVQDQWLYNDATDPVNPLKQIPTNRWGVFWFIISTNGFPIGGFHDDYYNTEAQAEDAAPPTHFDFAFPQMISKFVFQQGKDTAENIFSLWSVEGVAGSAVQDHGALAGLGNDTHLQYLHLTSPRIVTAQHNFTVYGTGDWLIGEWDLLLGDTVTNSGGAINVGGAGFAMAGGMGPIGSPGINLDQSVAIRNAGPGPVGNAEFVFIDSTEQVRFGIAKSGVNLGTYNPRSMIIAGPAVADDDIFTGAYWGFDNLPMDTGATGADLGVQHDVEILGKLWVDSIEASTPATPVTFAGAVTMGSLIATTGKFTGHVTVNASTADGSDTYYILRTADSSIGLLASRAVLDAGTKEDVGLYVYGANDLTFWTNSSVRMTIDYLGHTVFDGNVTTEALTATTGDFTGLINIDSASHAQIVLDRASNSNVSRLNFYTNGSLDWYIDTATGANDNLTFYSNGVGTALLLNSATLAVTCGGALAAQTLFLAEIATPGAPVDGQFWVTTTDALVRVNGVSHSIIAGGGSVGPGTVAYIPKWITTTTIGDSILYESGSVIYIDETDARIILKGGGAATGFLLEGSPAQHAYVWQYENANLYFGTDGVLRMTVAAAGAVDIHNEAYGLLIGETYARLYFETGVSHRSFKIGVQDTVSDAMSFYIATANAPAARSATYDEVFRIDGGGAHVYGTFTANQVIAGASSSSLVAYFYGSEADYIMKIRNVYGATAGYGLWVDTRWNTALNYVLRCTSNQGASELFTVEGGGVVTSHKQLVASNVTAAQISLHVTKGDVSGNALQITNSGSSRSLDIYHHADASGTVDDVMRAAVAGSRVFTLSRYGALTITDGFTATTGYFGEGSIVSYHNTGNAFCQVYSVTDDAILYLDSGMDGGAAQSTILFRGSGPTTYWTIRKDTAHNFTITDDRAGLTVVKIIANGDGSLQVPGDNSYYTVGSQSGGRAAVFGSTQNTDGGAGSYRAYMAYDAYWNNTEWKAKRTTLGHKWMIEIGYHIDAFRVRRYDGVVTSPWADSAWSNLFTVSNVGRGTFSSPDATIGSVTIRGGGTVTAVGVVNSRLDFEQNDGSITGTAGRIASVSEYNNGAWAGLAFYTTKQPTLAEAVRISSAGYVGIGVTNPSMSLTIQSTNTGVESDGTSLYLKAAGNTYLNTAANAHVSNAGRITGTMGYFTGSESNGQVGGSSDTGVRVFNGYSATYGALSEVIFGLSGGVGHMAAISCSYVEWDAAGFGGDLRFSTRYAGEANLTERMRIFQTGGVSINSASDPGLGNFFVGGSATIGADQNDWLSMTYSGVSYRANLDWYTLQLGNNGPNRLVAGNTAAGGYFAIYTNAQTDRSITGAKLTMLLAANGDVTTYEDLFVGGLLDVGGATITFGYPGATMQFLLDTVDGTDNSEIYYCAAGAAGFNRGATIRMCGNERSGNEGVMQLTAGADAAQGYMDFRTGSSGTVRMKIDYLGGITVGGGTQKGAGTINVASGLYKGGTVYTHPDYVFERAFTGAAFKYERPGYDGLWDLSKVKQYAQQHFHLPGLARDREELFERADIILEKLEEVFLYLFDHEDKLDELLALAAQTS